MVEVVFKPARSAHVEVPAYEVEPLSVYLGPHGPIAIGFGDDDTTTWVWGDEVPTIGIGWGPASFGDEADMQPLKEGLTTLGDVALEVRLTKMGFRAKNRRLEVKGEQCWTITKNSTTGYLIDRADGVRLGTAGKKRRLAPDASPLEAALFALSHGTLASMLNPPMGTITSSGGPDVYPTFG